MTEVTERIDNNEVEFYALLPNPMTINWQDVIVTVFTTVGGGGILLGAAAYLIKTVLTHQLDKETETFKAQLKASSDAEIERLKNSLQMTALEHQVRFSKLHEKRAEVIAELYDRLLKISRTELTLSIQFLPSAKGYAEPIKQLANEFNDFEELVKKHRIYLPLTVCKLLDEYSGTSFESIMNNFQSVVSTEHDFDKKTLDKARVDFNARISELKVALEAEFRFLLGERPNEPSSGGRSAI